jgi:hypothetical protein
MAPSRDRPTHPHTLRLRLAVTAAAYHPELWMVGTDPPPTRAPAREKLRGTRAAPGPHKPRSTQSRSRATRRVP